MNFFRQTKLVCLGISVSAFLSADTLTLRDGRVVQGTFLGGTAREIRMDTGSRVETFQVEGVSGVQFGGSVPFSRDETANRAPVPNQGSNYPPPQSNGGPPNGDGYEIPGGTQTYRASHRFCGFRRDANWGHVPRQSG